MIDRADVTEKGSEPDGLVFHQDPVEDLLKVFDTAFRLVVPGPGRRIVGLQSVSEKQNNAPGWYLWFDDHPGAYLLELAEAGTKTATDERRASGRQAVYGNYRIKYYPDIEDPSSLSLFSASERNFRKSDCFDATGTPDFDRGGEIPETLFQIGTIEAGLSADAGGLVLRLDTLDRWVARAAEGVTATDERGLVYRLRAPGEKDRDIPAWDWSWFLMDRLVLTLCLAYSSRPGQVALHDAPGCAFHIQPSGVSRAIPDGTVRRRWLSISFRLHDGHSSCALSRPTASEDLSLLPDAPPGELLALFRCEPAASHPWVPAAWWHVRENRLDLGGVLPC